ncbi:MAG: glycine zipper 2TM domain-containing protein [Planctomycetaceae bacterium]|nr:glycine zipper 2TM domain-containing protein [Planctomycetaceae bacterium]
MSRNAVLLSTVALLALTGCHTMSRTAQGTVLGSGAGAVTGAIVGHQLGHRNAGALLGGLAGGATGAVVGNEMDVREERDASVQYARHLEQAILADDKALSNYDLARLTASGASDDVIIATVRSQGGKFDLTADGIVQLKALGVSDRVILGIQQSATSPPAMVTVAPAYAPLPSSAVAPEAVSGKHRPWWRRVKSAPTMKSAHPAW